MFSRIRAFCSTWVAPSFVVAGAATVLLSVILMAVSADRALGDEGLQPPPTPPDCTPGNCDQGCKLRKKNLCAGGGGCDSKCETPCFCRKVGSTCECGPH